MKKYLLVLFLSAIITPTFAKEPATGRIIWKNDSSSNVTFLIPYDPAYSSMCLNMVENEIEYYTGPDNAIKIR
jgi:hypothetical protein